jgi:hypothetical protein
MSDGVKIDRLRILVKLSDGTVREVVMSEKDEILWAKALYKFYPKLTVMDKPIEEIKID